VFWYTFYVYVLFLNQKHTVFIQVTKYGIYGAKMISHSYFSLNITRLFLKSSVINLVHISYTTKITANGLKIMFGEGFL